MHNIEEMNEKIKIPCVSHSNLRARPAVNGDRRLGEVSQHTGTGKVVYCRGKKRISYSHNPRNIQWPLPCPSTSDVEYINSMRTWNMSLMFMVMIETRSTPNGNWNRAYLNLSRVSQPDTLFFSSPFSREWTTIDFPHHLTPWNDDQASITSVK